MAVIQPCATCWFRDKNCELKATMAARVRGLGFTVARFNCPILPAEFHPGRRVRATIRGGSSDGEDVYDAVVNATVIQKSTKPGKFLIWPDDDEHEALDTVKNERKLCALRSFLLEPMNEPDRPERVAELAALDNAEFN